MATFFEEKNTLITALLEISFKHGKFNHIFNTDQLNNVIEHNKVSKEV